MLSITNSQLNNRLLSIGKSYGLFADPPEVICKGTFQPTAKQLAVCQEMKQKLKYSERQMIALPDTDFLDRKPIGYLETEFAMTYARRHLGESVSSLTSGTLLCCPERNELFVQRRSKKSAASAGLYGMFGGHICLDQSYYGFGAFLDCLIKEILEETNLNILNLFPNFPNDLTSAAILEETSTGSIQYTPLCIAISESQANQLNGSSEGEIVTLNLKKDVEVISNPSNWSPMGFCNIASWVAYAMPLQDAYPNKIDFGTKNILQKLIFNV